MLKNLITFALGILICKGFCNLEGLGNLPYTLVMSRLFEYAFLTQRHNNIMNNKTRDKAKAEGLPLMDYILKRIKELEKETGVKRSIFAACPNSIAVLRASLKSAKRNNAPIKFAATLNQVDLDGGYTGMTQLEFVKTIREEARRINLQSPVIIAIDHGGPWLKDKHRVEKWTYEQSEAAVKESFVAAIEAGYDLIHVDPTVDITLAEGDTISIDVVAERTLDLIEHAENYRRKNGYDRISYEVGTEEVHGGLADMNVFKRFLTLLKDGLMKRDLGDVWPCFVVGKVGTDLHTTLFDPVVASELSSAAAEYGSFIKGHYSDNVENPEEYPLSGMGAANVGPEFTEKEYDALLELDSIEDELFQKGEVAKRSLIKEKLWDAVIRSGRWKKWLQSGESAEDFYSNSPERQEWLIKTGCRYIWEDSDVVASRSKLTENLKGKGIDADFIVSSAIEHAMDRYFDKFNLKDLNDLI
jgi:D-tagatose-1,6-bisphosphate aldolase subunit GatZ/KbaZ